MPSAQQTLQEFTDHLASSEPAPGGGGAAALLGAIGTCLGHMVGALTVGKKKYADVEGEMKGVMAEAAALSQDFLALIDEDAEAFLPLAAAYRLPAYTEDQIRNKAEVMEGALKKAAATPLTIMEKCCSALDLVTVFTQKGSLMAVSDAGCAASALKAALESAALNVLINTRSMTDRTYAETLNARVTAMLDAYCGQADALYTRVKDAFLPRKEP